MGLFNVNFKNLVTTSLPVWARTEPRLTQLNALIAPVVYLYNLFNTNREANLYYLAHSSQVCYIEAVLNDAFDNNLRRIVITDGANVESVGTYIHAELKPLGLHTHGENQAVALYTGGEVGGAYNGFVVQVPTAVSTVYPYSNAHIKALIDKYRLASKGNYTIQLV